MTREELTEKVRSLPAHPGVYMMKDKSGKVIYVGKSKCLKNRVPHYFQPIESLDVKTARLSEKICDFECLYTDNEIEALVLENELIKKYSPKYNIKLKDAKTYPYIKITREAYPKLVITRTRKDDGSKYFGPYSSALAAREIVTAIQKAFRVPNCNKNFEFGKKVARPCLNFHINQCCAPCTGDIDPAEYSSLFSEVESFLKGDFSQTIKDLNEKMEKASEQMRYEAAAQYRDRALALGRLAETQKIVRSGENEQDVFGFFETDAMCAIAVLFIRAGKLIDKDVITFLPDEMINDEALSDFVERYYKDGRQIPKSILLSFEISEETEKSLEEYFTDIAKRSVNVASPKRGVKHELAVMACENAKETLRLLSLTSGKDMKTQMRLAELLSLDALPSRIEAYDISNNGKDDIYAGMVVFCDGKPKKSDYRSFRINSVTDTPDDYASMREALTRRMKYLTEKNPERDDPSLASVPDIILIDGGRGHVGAVSDIIENAGLGIRVFGMVKDEYHKTRTLTDGNAEISIAGEQQVYSFIYNIQEEVHRFTLSKMDSARRKKVKTSSLEAINGIGKAKAKTLLSYFGSVSAIKNADVEKLCKCSGVNIALAKEIYAYFHESGDEGK